MAAVPVTIKGTLTTKATKEGGESGQQDCLLCGLLHITGLAVGGGPVVPPDELPPGKPMFPIWGPPGTDFPDKPGYPPVATHPIVLPDPPPPFPEPPTPPAVKPPPPEGGWGYHPDYGWGFFPGTGLTPGPKR